MAITKGVQGVDDLLDRCFDVRIEIKASRMGALSVDRGFDSKAEGARRLQRIDDMQVMRPGLGEVLPRMRSGVG